MALQLHHVFVCTSLGAPEAEALLDAGLVEGSPNTHPGQGTANRRFFFQRGFLEMLWVRDEREAQSTLGTPTKIWDRWAERRGTANPFGICFSSAAGLDSDLLFPTCSYQPDYLSGDRRMLFADMSPLSEPEIFVLSWPQDQSPPKTEPTTHPVGLLEMRSVSVGLPDQAAISSTLRAIADAGLIRVHESVRPELVLEFTSEKPVQHRIPSLGLLMIGRQAASSNKSLERA